MWLAHPRWRVDGLRSGTAVSGVGRTAPGADRARSRLGRDRLLDLAVVPRDLALGRGDQAGVGGREAAYAVDRGRSASSDAPRPSQVARLTAATRSRRPTPSMTRAPSWCARGRRPASSSAPGAGARAGESRVSRRLERVRPSGTAATSSTRWSSGRCGARSGVSSMRVAERVDGARRCSAAQSPISSTRRSSSEESRTASTQPDHLVGARRASSRTTSRNGTS